MANDKVEVEVEKQVNEAPALKLETIEEVKVTIEAELENLRRNVKNGFYNTLADLDHVNTEHPNNLNKEILSHQITLIDTITKFNLFENFVAETLKKKGNSLKSHQDIRLVLVKINEVLTKAIDLSQSEALRNLDDAKDFDKIVAKNRSELDVDLKELNKLATEVSGSPSVAETTTGVVLSILGTAAFASVAAFIFTTGAVALSPVFLAAFAAAALTALVGLVLAIHGSSATKFNTEIAELASSASKSAVNIVEFPKFRQSFFHNAAPKLDEEDKELEEKQKAAPVLA